MNTTLIADVFIRTFPVVMFILQDAVKNRKNPMLKFVTGISPVVYGFITFSYLLIESRWRPGYSIAPYLVIPVLGLVASAYQLKRDLTLKLKEDLDEAQLDEETEEEKLE